MSAEHGHRHEHMPAPAIDTYKFSTSSPRSRSISSPSWKCPSPPRSYQPGLPHPVAQVRRIAAGHQQDVSLPDPGDPPLLADAGQRCQLEDAQRLPAQAAHGQRHLAGDETPGRGWPAQGVAVLRRRDAQGTGAGDRLAQQAGQRIADARVLTPADVRRSLTLASCT